MATKKVGTLIKEARTAAGLTQEQLARKISGLSASDISAAERHQKDLTQDQLKKIAKATGVTQASLLNAAKGSSAKKTSSSSKSSMQVTATEKKLVQLYREADADTKKKVMNLLKDDDSLAGELLGGLLDNEDLLEGIMDTVQDLISGK